MSITTEEQRRQLEAAGWRLTHERPKSEDWRNQNDIGELTPYLDTDGLLAAEYCQDGTALPEDLNALVAALSILGLPIPGYRIERVEEGTERGNQ